MFGFGRRRTALPPGVSLPEEVATAIRDAGVDIGQLAPLFEPADPPAYIVPVAGRHGAAAWRRLRETLPAHGYWPAILGDDSNLQMREVMADERRDPREVIRRADAVDLDVDGERVLVFWWD